MTTAVVETEGVEMGGEPVVKEKAARRVEFDYLRAFVIVLVVWHHAILAYHSQAFINPENPVGTWSPVVDLQRWVGFDIMAGFNDIFFMALMFFVSGLFVWRSLNRKGAGKYLGDRLIRLGIPFVVGIVFLIPLAYYPAQLNVDLVYGGSTGYLEFWQGLAREGYGVSGPLWFLWLLLAFDALVALLYRLGLKPPLGGRLARMYERPLVFFTTLLVITTVAYLALAIPFGAERWIGVGPVVAQASRILFYLVYFGAGIALGAYGLDRGMLKAAGPLAKRWWGWLLLGLLAFAGIIALTVTGGLASLLAALVFTLTAAAMVFAVTAFFLRFATHRRGVFDSLANNAYGIYLVHYVFVLWLQFWLLGIDLAPIPKALLVFAGALALSWGTAAALRRIPLVDRVI